MHKRISLHQTEEPAHWTEVIGYVAPTDAVCADSAYFFAEEIDFSSSSFLMHLSDNTVFIIWRWMLLSEVGWGEVEE